MQITDELEFLKLYATGLSTRDIYVRTGLMFDLLHALDAMHQELRDKEHPLPFVRDAIRVLKDIGHKSSIDVLVNISQMYEGTYLQDHAYSAIVEIDNSKAFDILMPLYVEGDQEQRRITGLALSQLKSAVVIPKLIEYADHPSQKVRLLVASRLGAIGDTKIIPILIDMFKRETSSRIRAHLIEYIGVLAHGNAINLDVFREALESQNIHLIRSGIFGLSHINTSEALELLLTLDDSNNELSTYLEVAIEKIQSEME